MSSAASVRQSIAVSITTWSPAAPAASAIVCTNREPSAPRSIARATRAGPLSTTRRPGRPGDPGARRACGVLPADLPGGKAIGEVVEDLEPDRCGEELSPVELVEDTRDVAVAVDLDPEALVLEEALAGRELR